jgi:predicted alpha/beta-fold hydrolase
MKMIYLMMKKTFLKMMNQNLKEKLKGYAKIAHEQFDNAFTEIANRTQAIASVDNAMYDMEQKHKVKTLTKPNDDQK